MMLTRKFSLRTKPSRFLPLAVSALILAILALHTYRFARYNYREDELDTVHAATTLSLQETVAWVASEAAHPPGWQVVAVTWVKLFGIDEAITRFLSTLSTALGLALLFRLAADVFDVQVGLLAILLLGTLPFFQFHSHEFRPYSAVVPAIVGMQVTFLRWLKHPHFPYALLYVLFGIISLQTVYFAGYIVVAQAIFLVVMVRPKPGLTLRAFGLFAAIALAFFPWLLPLLHTTLYYFRGGVGYSVPSDVEGLALLFRQTQGMLIFVIPALFIPTGAIYPFLKSAPSPRFRFDPEWRRWYLILCAGGSLLLAFALNLVVKNVTVRNMMIILPPIAVLAAFQLRAYRRPVALPVICGLLLVGGLNFHKYYISAPYLDVNTYLSQVYHSGDRIVTNINHQNNGAVALTYYLLDRLPAAPDKRDFFHILESSTHIQTYTAVDPLVNIVRTDSPENVQLFKAFLQPATRIWYIQYIGPPYFEDTPLTQSYMATLHAQFEPASTMTFPMAVPPEGVYRITEFVHRPS